MKPPERRSEIAKKATLARWRPVKEEDYADFHDFYQALKQKGSARAIYPLPNRSLKILHQDKLMWVRPLKLIGRELIARIFAPLIDESVKIGEVVCVDVTQITAISGKRIDETELIIAGILAKTT